MITFLDGNYDHAVRLLEIALSFNPSNDVSSMIYYHLSLVFERLGKLSLVYSYSTKALELFTLSGNSIRQLEATLQIGNVHLKSNQFDEAENTYSNLLQRSKIMKDDYIQVRCLYNLSLLRIKQHDYLRALNYLKSVEEYESLNDEGLLKEGYCYYRLNQLEDFNTLFKRAVLQFKPDSPQLSELKIINYKVNNINNQQYLNHLLNHLDNFLHNDDIERVLRVINDIIEYYESKRMYKYPNRYHNLKNELLSIDPSL